jgi:hypothetical protein
MSHDSINSWVEKAKNLALGDSEAHVGIRIIRNGHKKSASPIMEIADRLRPWLLQMYAGVRDAHGMPVQPAHIRGLALNVAQDIVKGQQKKAS